MAIGFTLTLLLATLFLIKFFGKRYHWKPEWQRKMLHLSLGVIAISFQWVFDEVWPVAIVCFSTVFVMLAIRKIPKLRKSIGISIHAVDRPSIGELLFAVVIVLLYYLSKGNAVLYVVPLAILALSDAAAALVGTHFGVWRFDVVDGKKSWEGFITFFVVTAVILFALLLLLSDLSLLSIMLISLIFSMLGALIEAISWRGWDNFFIPLAAHLFLASILKHETSWLFYQLLILGGLVVFGLRVARVSHLNTHALMTVIVAAYYFGVVGGLVWVLVPLLVFMCHTAFCVIYDDNEAHYTVATAMSLSSCGFFWLLMDRLLNQPEVFLCYSHAFAIHLQIITLLRLKAYRGQRAEPMIVMLTSLLSGALILSLPLIYLGTTPTVIAMYVTALLVMVVGGMKTSIDVDRFSRTRWIVEGKMALIGSLSPLLTLYVGKFFL